MYLSDSGSTVYVCYVNEYLPSSKLPHELIMKISKPSIRCILQALELLMRAVLYPYEQTTRPEHTLAGSTEIIPDVIEI